MSRPLPLLSLAIVLASSASAPAQMARAIADGIANSDGPPGLTSITPPGGTLGKSTEWTVSGTNLSAVSEWKITGAGVSIVGVKADRTAATLRVTVDANASPGYREVRAFGPKGVSNLALVRLDRQGMVQESEPNDLIENATPIPAGSAAWGILKAQDLDHFRIAGKAGRRVTIDLEAQRLGTPISPVITLMTAKGSALAQGRESLGTDHDARLAFTFPADGEYVILVRDNLYAGGDSAVYRLSVEDSPFATGLFPLGGPRGGKVEVTVSGGNLPSPLTRTVTLPDQPGAIFVPGPFEGQGGGVLSPMKMVVGDGMEAYEAGSPTAIPAGVGVVNGRLERTQRGRSLHARGEEGRADRGPNPRLGPRLAARLGPHDSRRAGGLPGGERRPGRRRRPAGRICDQSDGVAARQSPRLRAQVRRADHD